MNTIPTPTKLEYIEGENHNKGNIIIEPCYPGYGITIANALRRVLLSSLPGAAVTSFKIKNVQHEFSSIPYVKEDVVEISLNLKKLRLKIIGDESVRLNLRAKGEKKVTAEDITPVGNVELVNPHLHIATLTDKSAEFEMELVAINGRGYSPTENRNEELEIGMITIDALFGPIINVSYKIENVRVGQMTNWDKIILEIESDGSMSPKGTLNLATQYLIDQFQFINTLTKETPEEHNVEKETVKTEAIAEP